MNSEGRLTRRGLTSRAAQAGETLATELTMALRSSGAGSDQWTRPILQPSAPHAAEKRYARTPQRGLPAATKGVRNDVAPVRLSGGYEPDTPSRRQRHADLSSPTPVADSRDDQRFRLRFFGQMRMLSFVDGLAAFLSRAGVLLKHLGAGVARGDVGRLLALLRAHGLIKKVAKTHRYQVTPSGRTRLAAIYAARKASVEQLTSAA